jgi:hypothetical protein
MRASLATAGEDRSFLCATGAETTRQMSVAVAAIAGLGSAKNEEFSM